MIWLVISRREFPAGTVLALAVAGFAVDFEEAVFLTVLRTEVLGATGRVAATDDFGLAVFLALMVFIFLFFIVYICGVVPMQRHDFRLQNSNDIP